MKRNAATVCRASRSSREDNQTRRLVSFEPKTLNLDAGTVEATISSEGGVERYDWMSGQRYTEILVHEPAAIDFKRIEGGPLLDSHKVSSSIGDIIGRVENVRLVGKKLVATLRFSKEPEGQSAMRKVSEGVIRFLSIGYRIIKEREQRAADGHRTVSITRWMPFEASFVAVPADTNAQIRSMETTGMDPEDDIETIDDNETTEETRNRSRSSPAAQRISRQIDAVRDQAVRAGISEIDAEDMLDGVRSVSVARGRVLDALAEMSRSIRTDAYSGIHGRMNESQTDTRACVVDALAVRMGATATLASNPLAGVSLSGAVRALMESSGAPARNLDDRQVMERAFHTTSDFPLLLGDAVGRALVERFNAEATPLKMLSTQRNARDFREQSLIRPGEAPLLDEVAEGGEIKSGTMREEKEVFRLVELAKMISLSRQAMINDDLGGFSDLASAFVRQAADTEAEAFYKLISSNTFGGVKLFDNKNLFHADHGNLGTGAQLSVTSLGAARKAMRLQKNVNGTGRAGAVPAILVVGPALETEAEKVIAEIAAAQISDVNPFSGKLKVLVENRYEGNGWWLFADPKTRPAFVHGYLDGREGPQVEVQEGWRISGVEFRCRLDFGCGVYDWRAAHFNPGT